MTANCPICGGKWDVIDRDYTILLRCGDEFEILCDYCNTEIEFILSRKSLEESNIRRIRGYEEVIKDLQWNLKKEKEKHV